MKIKTSKLEGHQLNYAVAIAEGWQAKGVVYSWGGKAKLKVQKSAVPCEFNEVEFNFAYDWAQGGEIVGREGISVVKEGCNPWAAWTPASFRDEAENFGYGETALIAAMRCYVASKLGDEVEIPETVINN